jgi:membrane fusion protein, multidrug efflux system
MTYASITYAPMIYGPMMLASISRTPMRHTALRHNCGALGVVLLGVTLLLAGCAAAPEQSATAPAGHAEVQVIPVRSAPLEEVYEAAGTVRAGQRAVLASQIQGTILALPVKLGDAVRAGQLLAELDAGELEAALTRAEAGQTVARQAYLQEQNALTAAQAEADLAAVTLQRYQELFEKKSISRQELDQTAARQRTAQAGLDSARARVEEAQARQQEAAAAVQAARVRREYSRITAPFAGLVTEKNVDAGTLVSAGEPLLSIEEAGGYQLEVAVAEAHLPVARIGGPVRVSIPSIGLQIASQIVEMQPAADAASRSAIVRIRLPAAAGLHSGLFGRATFSVGTVNALTVPESAVLRQGQLVSVFVVSDGRARRRLITTGRQSEGKFEVLSGLTEGEQVVVSDPSLLTDAEAVEIRR